MTTYMNGLQPDEIQCHGDSITAFGWPERLGMVNRGVGGAGWVRSINSSIPTIGRQIQLDWDAGHRPKGIIALGGTNDMMSVNDSDGSITSVYWAQIETAVWCRNKGIDIRFGTQIPYGNPAQPGATGQPAWVPELDRRRMLYLQWMRSQWGPQLCIADVEGWLRDGGQFAAERFILPDRTHLSEAGKARLAEAMAGVLADR